MRRMWKEIKEHRVSAALFALYWLVALGLEVAGWRKPPHRPEDMVLPVIVMHLVLPVVAGAVVGGWRRYGPGGITGGMLAGAAVLVVDVAAILAHAFLRFHLGDVGDSSEGIFEAPVLFIGLGLLGSLLGLVGAAASAGVSHLLPQPPAAGPEESGAVAGNVPLPRRILSLAGGCVLATAAIVALVVIPAVRADAAVGSRAATAFAVNVAMNLLIAIVLLAPVSRRSGGARRVVVVMAGFVGLLLGSALLDAASVFRRRGPELVVLACIASAAGDLGAGILALMAGLRRRVA